MQPSQQPKNEKFADLLSTPSAANPQNPVVLFLDPIRIGANLKQLRLEQGFTQQQIAALLKCEKPKISKMESGNHTYRMTGLRDLRKLADFYGVDVDFILKNENFADLTQGSNNNDNS